MSDRPCFRYVILLPVPPKLAVLIHALRQHYGLWRKAVPQDRLHLTLWVSCDYEHPQTMLVALLRAAMDEAGLPSCSVKLDFIESGEDWVGLTPRRPLRDLAYLQRCIAGASRRHGIPQRPGFDFAAHVTLSYRPSFALSEPVAELAWTPSEITLVESHVGCGKHVVLGRWPLGTAPARLQHELALG